MPKGRELKKLLAPLLERRRDLAYQRRLVFFRPLTHFLRGALFRPTTFAIVLDPVCDQLFDGCSDHHLGGRFGEEVHKARERHYPFEIQHQERMWQDMLVTLERDMLATVEPLNDPVSFDRSKIYASDQRGWQWDRILNHCAIGDFDAAERLLDAAVARSLDGMMKDLATNLPDERDEDLKFHGYEFRRLYYLHRVFKRNRAEVIPLLREWEAYKVGTLKLEKFWTPTPFPCER